MHAHSGAWRCCDGKVRAIRVQCELLLAATFIVLCWTLNLHWCVLLASSEKITRCDHWITAFFHKSMGFILRDALPGSQRLCANGLFENCQVQMFVKQPNRHLQQLLAVENKTILHQLKPSTLYMMSQLTLIFYPHHTGMRSEMLYTNRSFEICQEQMFVKQHRKTAEAVTCCRKKYLCSSKNRQISTRYVLTP